SCLRGGTEQGALVVGGRCGRWRFAAYPPPLSQEVCDPSSTGQTRHRLDRREDPQGTTIPYNGAYCCEPMASDSPGPPLDMLLRSVNLMASAGSMAEKKTILSSATPNRALTDSRVIAPLSRTRS